MDLPDILNRFAEGIVAVDSSTTRISRNQRTGVTYMPGVKTLAERKFVEELVTWWKTTYPNDFHPPKSIKKEVKYPNIPRAKCDLVLGFDGINLATAEWAIEVKHIALVGNNGKNNDYGVAKILSPYLKDRSLFHDLDRLRTSSIGTRRAVVAYSFEYDRLTYSQGLQIHSNQKTVLENIKSVCERNDPHHGEYHVLPLAQFADDIFQSKKIVGPMEVQNFTSAWRHPAGGNGKVFGWELLQPPSLIEQAAVEALEDH